MSVASVFAVAGLSFSVMAPPAEASTASDNNAYEAISAALNAAASETGATGAALLIGERDAILYVETAGKTTLTTPINVPARSDLAQLTLVLALADSGFIGLDDPVRKYLMLEAADPAAKSTIRRLMAVRAAGGEDARAAAKTLMLVAESASARSWDELFKDRVAAPLGMEKTSYPKSPGLSAALSRMTPTGAVQTTTRDYARLAALYANAGASNGSQILSHDALALFFRSQIIGMAACARIAPNESCGLIEQDSFGLYAWIDRTRGLYGVMAAPDAQMSVTKLGRQIRAQAEAIYDREQAEGDGLTSAVKARH